jgi:hypothetical protein
LTPGSGIRIRDEKKSMDEHPGTCFENLVSVFCVIIKILKFFDADADPGWKNSDPGSWIRDKHPGSATLQVITTEGSRLQAGFISRKPLFTVLGALNKTFISLF